MVKWQPESGALSVVYANYDSNTHTFVWDCCGSTVVESHEKVQVGSPIPPTCGEVYTDGVTPATGHSFLNDFCIHCGLDSTKSIVITMTSSWDKGWYRNGIIVYEDGVEIGMATIEPGTDYATAAYGYFAARYFAK